MRYFESMDLLGPTLAALIASSAAQAPATAHARHPGPALRYDRGSTSQFTVRARIIRASARVGDGLAPPHPRMVPRRTTLSAADGRPVAALVYDFE